MNSPSVKARQEPNGAVATSAAPRWAVWLVGAVTSLMREAGSFVSNLLIAVIRLYQHLISPCLRPCCRFVPSCSAYAVESLRKHGLARGVAKAAWRLARCQPFARGGLDEP